MSQQIGIPMHCLCGHNWTYMGKEPKYTPCPKCRSTISLRKHRTDGLGAGYDVHVDARRHMVLNLKEPLFKDRKLLKK